MTDVATLQRFLAKSFCEQITVQALPKGNGFSVSTPFTDNGGDRIAFYAKEDSGSFILEDDGSYLAHLVASGIDIDKGQRQSLLQSVLASSGAYWDQETFEIRAVAAPGESVGERAVDFISALMRVRDLELLTKDVVRSTFKEDALRALHERFDHVAVLEERASLSEDFSDYPADIVLRPRTGGRDTAVFFVNSATQFLEAELLHGEIAKLDQKARYAAIALVEDPEKINSIGLRRWARATNRGLPTPVFRGDERASLNLIEDRLAA